MLFFDQQLISFNGLELPHWCETVIFVVNLLVLFIDNRYMKRLCVKGNHYDPSSNDSLAEMLACNNTITDLNLGTCDLRGN